MQVFKEVHPAKETAWARSVVIHGLGEHSGRHLGTIAAMNAAGVEVVRYDWRGCGRSPGEAQWIERFQDYVEDALSVVQWTQTALPPLPLMLHGHSAGGCIALHTAAALGSKLHALVLSAPAFEVGAGISKGKILAGRLLARVTPKLRIHSTLDLTALSRDAAVAKAYVDDPLTCRFNTVRQGNELLAAMARMPEAAAKVSVPTLIVHGEKDRLIPVSGSPRLLAALASKDKTLKLFAGAFHELHNDLGKAEYFAFLTDWLLLHRK